MRSSEYTKNLLRKNIRNWKTSIANGEFQTVVHARRMGDFLKLYNVKKENSWILKTIEDLDMKKNLKKCENIVLVGCGLYPYSLFDMHRRYPHIKYHGIEISKKRAKLAELLVSETPAKGGVTIYCSPGEEFDYSFIGENDLVFISCDVKQNNIINQVYKTSEAQVFPCAPYKSSYVNGIFT